MCWRKLKKICTCVRMHTRAHTRTHTKFMDFLNNIRLLTFQVIYREKEIRISLHLIFIFIK